jgi:hypothetical protein
MRRLRPWNVVAWSVVLASTLALASLFHAVAGSALRGPAMTAPGPGRPSPATAALADGDDVRARFLAGRPAATCAMIVDQPLYVGQNTSVPQAYGQCIDPQP